VRSVSANLQVVPHAPPPGPGANAIGAPYAVVNIYEAPNTVTDDEAANVEILLAVRGVGWVRHCIPSEEDINGPVPEDVVPETSA